MASVKTMIYLGVCLSAWSVITADKAENVQWMSLDFKTTLTWTQTAPNYTYTVLFSRDQMDWEDHLDCSPVSEPVCDMTNHLIPFDGNYTANIRTEPAVMNSNYDPEELPHTYSSKFNPYRESNISAVEFIVKPVDKSKVTVNITEPLTSIHRNGKQLSIRDIFKKDLKYKISYYKAGSTGKRDIVSNSSTAEVSGLDEGQSYCFMVAAYIPSRPKATQQGTWSQQSCTDGDGNPLQDLRLGVWVGAVFILLIVVIIIITGTVLCCRCCKNRSKTLHTSQSSAPV